jgi:hypothetical protein
VIDGFLQIAQCGVIRSVLTEDPVFTTASPRTQREESERIEGLCALWVSVVRREGLFLGSS